MRRINRAIAASALSVPFALGAPAVALADDGGSEDVAVQNSVQSEEQGYDNGSDEEEDDSLLGLGILGSDNGDNGDEEEDGSFLGIL